jgi:thiol-disulfide isomerase/thioredoxin
MLTTAPRLGVAAFLSLAGFGLLELPLARAEKPKIPTVNEAYPGLSTGILRNARLADLKKGVVLSAEGVEIKESMLDDFVKEEEPQLREQLRKNLFFILEQQALEKILLHEARKSGHDNGPDEQAIMGHLNEKAAGVKVSEEELISFYHENKEALGGMPFEQVRDPIGEYVLEQKRKGAIAVYIQALGQGRDILVDAQWTKKQSVAARENPVDRARSTGKATMVEFGATGCKPCDMMQPILSSLRKKYQEKLNVVFVHVGEEQILAARYGISSIPVQVFFAGNGEEVFRHVGFYPENEIEKRLSAMGVK